MIGIILPNFVSKQNVTLLLENQAPPYETRFGFCETTRYETHREKPVFLLVGCCWSLGNLALLGHGSWEFVDGIIPYHPWDRYIYSHEWLNFVVNVGKYTGC